MFAICAGLGILILLLVLELLGHHPKGILDLCNRRVTNLGIFPVTGESQVWELSESHKIWNCPCHKRVTNLGIAPVTGKSQICDWFITVSAKCCDLSFQRESHVAQCHTLWTNVIMLVINSNSVSFFLRVTLVQDVRRDYWWFRHHLRLVAVNCSNHASGPSIGKCIQVADTNVLFEWMKGTYTST